MKSVLHLLHGWNVVSIFLLYYVNLRSVDADPTRRPYDTCDAVHRAHVNYPKKIYDASTRRAVYLPSLEIPGRIYPSVINVEIRRKKIGRQERGRMLFENGNLSRFDAPVAMSINQPLLRLPVLHLRYFLSCLAVRNFLYQSFIFVLREMIMIS